MDIVRVSPQLNDTSLNGDILNALINNVQCHVIALLMPASTITWTLLQHMMVTTCEWITLVDKIYTCRYVYEGWSSCVPCRLACTVPHRWL